MTSAEFEAFQRRISQPKRVPSTGQPGRPKTSMKHRITKDEQGLNKTEAAYYEHLKKDPGNVWIGVEPFSLKLADKCRYTPDFVVLRADGKLVAHEVKGFFREDSKIKLKVAARLFSWIEFRLAFKDKSLPTGWRISTVDC